MTSWISTDAYDGPDRRGSATLPGPRFAIGGRPIGPDHPPYVIAELSGNHGGSLDTAMAVLDAAADAGADALKLQTFTPSTITIDADLPELRVDGGLWGGRTLADLYAEAMTPWEWIEPLIRRGAERGIHVFSSPFDPTAVDFLDALDVPAFKIASPELVDLPLIRRCAATGRPLVVSTGMATWHEITQAVEAARAAGADQLALLHCVSAYPAPAEEANLATIKALADTHDVVPGLSDHTLGTTVAVAAVALGACIIEKHVTLRRADGGVDSAFSLEPHELAELVAACRMAWAAKGRVRTEPAPSEVGSRRYRRSLRALVDIVEGQVVTADMVASLRPAGGLAPDCIEMVIGRRAAAPIARGSAITADDIAWLGHEDLPQ
jgi:pseudaminic acid synthase